MNNLGIMLCIDRQGDCIDQTRQVTGAADFFQLSLFFQPVGQCDQVYGFCFVKQVDNGGKNFLMGGTVKIFRCQNLNDV